MEKEILTRCGYRCDLCLAYKENIAGNDQRHILSEGWHKLYGFRVEPEQIFCEGCISSKCTEIKLQDNSCPVRPCVIEKGLENCSQCDDYICDRLRERIVIYEDLQKKAGQKISRQEYTNFIKPYEGKKRLDALRAENYPHSRMLNKEMAPDDDDILKFLGQEPVVEVWKQLTAFINQHYLFGRAIEFGGKKYGWNVTYKQSKKTIISLFPERKSFTVLFVFGRKELEEIEADKARLTREMIDKINAAKQYHDGKWLWLRIENQFYVNDLTALLKIKRKPKK